MADELGPTGGSSIRVVHPLGWTFEAVGAPADVQRLWEGWLSFLKPQFISSGSVLVTGPMTGRTATVTVVDDPKTPEPKPRAARVGLHWTQRPENSAKVADMLAKAKAARKRGGAPPVTGKNRNQTRACWNCGTGTAVGAPCVMCNSPEQRPTPPSPDETREEHTQRVLDDLRSADR